MKTKTILTYGAIAAGAYLAYRYFMKPKAEANFANANGDAPEKILSKEYLFQKHSNYPKINLISCYKKLEDRVRNWRLFYTQPMTRQEQEMFFEDCLKNSSKKPSIYDKANIGSVIGR